MVAVGDPRTNSLLVTAGRDTMAQIAEMIGRLDGSNAKKQNVYFHALEHADADSVANSCAACSATRPRRTPPANRVPAG